MKQYKDLTKKEQTARMTASFIFGSITREDIINACYAEDSPRFENIIEAVKNISNTEMEHLSSEMAYRCCSNFHKYLKEEFEKKKLI